MTAKNQAAQTAAAPATDRRGIPLTASLVEDPERLARMWAMTPAERVAAAQQGQFSLGEMLRWASRRGTEVPLLEGEFFFLSNRLCDVIIDHGKG